MRLPAPPQTHHHPLGQKSGFCQLQMNRIKAFKRKVWQIQINSRAHTSSGANSAHSANKRGVFSNRGGLAKKVTQNYCGRVWNSLYKHCSSDSSVGVELRWEWFGPRRPNRQTLAVSCVAFSRCLSWFKSITFVSRFLGWGGAGWGLERVLCIGLLSEQISDCKGLDVKLFGR